MIECTILIFGATGDLSQRKLIPALYSMYKQSRNQIKFIFVGAAKDDISIDQLFDLAKENIEDFDQTIYEELKKISYYHRVDFNELNDFKKLAYKIYEYEKKYNLKPNRLIYLAAPADFFCRITQNLSESNIISKLSNDNIWQRVVYEKPFGWDLNSAKSINECIEKYISENQIYRIDHYLTKALVNSITLFRFSNIVFEAVWSSDYIDNIQIIFSETASIEKRGEFYDRYGALKDVVQNHMLQILSLIAMEKPVTLDQKSITESKSEVLKNISIEDGILGQYEGYLQEENVKKDSKTETYVALKCFVDMPRWSNVPFYLKTGKCLYKKSTEIHIVFKKVSKKLFLLPGFYDSNILSIRISPDSGFSFRLNALKGSTDKILPMTMDLCYRCLFGFDLPRSYQVLISEIMKGDKGISVSWPEIKYSWKFIEQVNNLQLPMYRYKQGSYGPEKVLKFSEKYNFNWLL